MAKAIHAISWSTLPSILSLQEQFVPYPANQKNQSYRDRGLNLGLSGESKGHPELPDWRAVFFSLIFPLPDPALPSPESQEDEEFEGVKGLYDAHGFLRVPSSWSDGRFQGVRRIELSTDDAGQAYYQKANNRFGRVLGDSVGADAIDNRPSENHETRCVRYDFSQDVTSEETTIIIPQDFSNHHPGASIRLVSAELLQYGHMQNHDARSGGSHAIITRFLVMHVVAENCSTELLDKLSQALHRPRRRLGPYEAETSRILHGLVMKIRRRMSFPHHPLTFVMAPGGYLERPSNLTYSKQQTTPEERAFHSHLLEDDAYGKSQIKIPTALRTVCAVPGNPNVRSAPEIWRDTNQVAKLSETAWLHQWSWSLATGADEYWEGIPCEEGDSESTDSFRRFRHWTLCATESGVAHVRHPYAGTQDVKFWMLSMTRYVDLAILVQRCFIALSTLSSRLRGIHDDAVKNLNDSKEGDPSDEFQLLEQELELLGKLQEDFVQFRDRLWFNVVPKHSSDTHVLKSLRRASGVDDIYDDLVDEIGIRKEVYNTRSAQHRMRKEHQEQQNRREEEKRHREERKKDEANQREENRRAEWSNRILGVMAAALAAPGFMDLTGWDHGWPLVTATVTLAVILTAIIWLLVRPRSGDAPPRPSRNRDHSR